MKINRTIKCDALTDHTQQYHSVNSTLQVQKVWTVLKVQSSGIDLYIGQAKLKLETNLSEYILNPSPQLLLRISA